MAKCSECGANIPDNTRFCPQCGAAAAAAAAGAAGQGAYQQQNYQPGSAQQQSYQQQQSSQQAYQQNYQQNYQQQNYQQQYAKPKPVAPSPDAEKLRLLIAISYWFFPAALIALILDKDSNYARSHVNQVIALYVWALLCSLCMIVPIIGWIVGGLGVLAALIFTIICFFRALRYNIFIIPITGKWQFIPLKD